MITESAYAKINLSLDITGKRPDGYHEVRMVMQTIDLKDTLTFEKADHGITLLTDSETLNKEQEEEMILEVEVFNASDHNGLAAEVARYLRTLNNEGVFKVDVINFSTSSERLNTTKIVALTKRLDALKELSKHLGLTNTEIHYMEDKNAICEARVYLGEDFKLPKTAK